MSWGPRAPEFTSALTKLRQAHADPTAGGLCARCRKPLLPGNDGFQQGLCPPHLDVLESDRDCWNEGDPDER